MTISKARAGTIFTTTSPVVGYIIRVHPFWTPTVIIRISKQTQNTFIICLSFVFIGKFTWIIWMLHTFSFTIDGDITSPMPLQAVDGLILVSEKELSIINIIEKYF